LSAGSNGYVPRFAELLPAETGIELPGCAQNCGRLSGSGMSRSNGLKLKLMSMRRLVSRQPAPKR